MSDSCTAVIQAAEIDTGTTIHLLTYEMNAAVALTGSQFREVNHLLQSRAEFSNVPMSPIEIVTAPPLIDPFVSLTTGKAHGLFAFEDYRDQHAAGEVIWAYYPRCAALIPNISRAVNRNGLLTTSLYFRFSESRLPLLFDGDGVRPVYCFTQNDVECPRLFPYDPAQGRELLKRISPSPRVIRLHFSEPSLSKVAYYFTDILSRDRIQVEIVGNEKDADLIIAYVPIRIESPVLALEHLYQKISELGVPAGGQRSDLAVIQANLDSIRDAPTLADSLQICAVLDRILTEEFGVFPLFQHRIYFHASELLQNYRFDKNGLFDCTELVKLKIPADSGAAP
jgi:hypothetical protein